MRWPNIAAVALGMVAGVLAHYMPDQAAYFYFASGGLIAAAFPQVSPPPRAPTLPPI